MSGSIRCWNSALPSTLRFSCVQVPQIEHRSGRHAAQDRPHQIDPQAGQGPVTGEGIDEDRARSQVDHHQQSRPDGQRSEGRPVQHRQADGEYQKEGSDGFGQVTAHGTDAPSLRGCASLLRPGRGLRGRDRVGSLRAGPLPGNLRHEPILCKP